MPLRRENPPRANRAIVWPDGSVHTLAGRWQVFKDELGTPTRATASFDVTNRRQMDAELASHHAEIAHLGRVATIGELSASLAHELNQPLAAILSNAEAARLLLKKDSPPLEEIGAILERYLPRRRPRRRRNPANEGDAAEATLAEPVLGRGRVDWRRRETCQRPCPAETRDDAGAVRRRTAHGPRRSRPSPASAAQPGNQCHRGHAGLPRGDVRCGSRRSAQETERSRFWYATTAREFPPTSVAVSLSAFSHYQAQRHGHGTFDCTDVSRPTAERSGRKIRPAKGQLLPSCCRWKGPNYEHSRACRPHR